jgi:hypothetical protein
MTRRTVALQGSAAATVFAGTFAIRTWGLRDHLWLLGDQIRDWGIALRPFGELPLVGPPTHFGGYSLGPAYYWLMWAIRVTIGPLFDNLPHAGGYGQAVLESAADALLVVAVWRRTQAPALALAFIVLVATAAYDVCLSAIVWTSPVASALGKIAIALILLDWHRRSAWRVAVIAALAWAGVQIYTGNIFVAVGVFAALAADSIDERARDWRPFVRRVCVIAGVVLVMQLPYAAHQVRSRVNERGMDAVTASVAGILSGRAQPEVGKSVRGLAAAFDFIQGAPWHIPYLLWVLLLSACLFVVRVHRDRALALVTALPLAAAIAGYAVFQGTLEPYTFLSLMSPAVLMVLVALTPAPKSRAGMAAGIVVLLGALAIVPARLQQAAQWHKLPEYRVLVQASRKIVGKRQPMRAVQTAFVLPPTSDPAFIYTVLGGRLDRASPWVAVIQPDGNVIYNRRP